jgi:hypothetical protein
MKTLFLVSALIVSIASLSFAGTPQKIGFRAYSSATSTQCGIFGMKQTLTRDDNNVPIQIFSPSPELSRTITLGNKGFGTYSTAIGARAIMFTCRLTPVLASTASTAVRVKVFMNAVETHFLTMSEGTLVIGQ